MLNSALLPAMLLLALVPAGSPAQTLYKCVLKGKPTSYQTEPCPSRAKIAAIRDYRPEPPPSYGQLEARRQQEARGQEESAYLSRIAGTNGRGGGASGHVLPAGGDACEKAKRDRDAWERQAGLSRSYDSLRHWADVVARACR